MLEPRISVIVPVYNRERTIETCVSGILTSQYKNIELIIVDDGSSDNTYSVCQKIAETDNRVILVRQDNKGVSVARNAALDIASGDWVTFVDSDDTVSPLCYSYLNGGGICRSAI